ncbi:IS5/IS1182 family transposase, partial [Rickettsiales endosymbiont of Peranema trichophorum]|uniref:hypothetical protein n=1 Tax=Rickettsiales endosymbiont of Peranema trichophorum TaxID=2486577 RepID=UPI0010EFCD8B
MSFLKIEAEHRIQGSKVMRLCGLIKWRRLEAILCGLGRSGYGPNGYDVVQLLKALILQSWYSLSD